MTLSENETTDAEQIFAHLTEAMQERLDTDKPDLSPIISDLLAVPPARIAKPEDAAKFLHLLGFLSRGLIDETRAWDWATAVAASNSQNAGVLSLLASLGDLLRTKENTPVANVIRLPQLEALFHQAMTITPDQPGAFARAGLFYLNNQNDREAERCLRRAFDLDPRNEFVCIQLSDLLTRTDRPADGLAVLDRCVRAGEPPIEVLWKAGLAATLLAKPDAALTYLTDLLKVEPERRWANYYCAIALLALKRFAEAAVAIDQESSLIKMPTALHVHTVRAAAAAGLADWLALRQNIEAAVAPPLSLINYLAQAGIVGCFTRLWAAAGKLPADDPSRLRLQHRILSSGLTPDEFWDQIRAGQEKIKGLKHFWIDLLQPLDARWSQSGSALPGQERWKVYTVRYGVLATNEIDAVDHALLWQLRSAPLSAEVTAVTLDGGPYTDVPGITQREYPTGRSA